jgi:predicted flap endonuclease-1-like 5' DNA nuclease
MVGLGRQADQSSLSKFLREQTRIKGKKCTGKGSDMKRQISELRKLKGIGEILARRLFEAGYDTLAKVAAAGEENLRKIPGVNPRMLSQIVAQAGSLAEEAAKSRDEKIEELKSRAASMKMRINELAVDVRDRFREEISGKTGGKVEKEIRKFVLSLEKIEGKLPSRAKKAAKGLVKAESRIAALSDCGLDVVGKKIRKARKSLKKVYM